jgi:hypothetical protein
MLRKKEKKPGKNGYRNKHKKERGTRRRRRRTITTTTTTARALGHQGGRRKKQFGGGRTGGGRELSGELATALRGELGYKQGFWQQGDLITINVIIDR